MTLTFKPATMSCHGDHLCQIIYKSQVMAQTRTGFTEVYEQSLSADCDFDLRPSNMVLHREISSCHDDHLCQIIFKSHHV